MDPSTVPKGPIAVRRWILVSSSSHLKGKKQLQVKSQDLFQWFVGVWIRTAHLRKNHPISQQTPSSTRREENLAQMQSQPTLSFGRGFYHCFFNSKAAPEINPKRVYNSPPIHSFQWLCCENLMFLRNMMDAMWFFSLGDAAWQMLSVKLGDFPLYSQNNLVPMCEKVAVFTYYAWRWWYMDQFQMFPILI